MDYTEFIGKTMGQTQGEDWSGWWPIIDSEGVITGVVDGTGNDDTEHLTPVDYVDGKIVTISSERANGYGFDAYMELD